MTLLAIFAVLLVIRILLQLGVFGKTSEFKTLVHDQIEEAKKNIQETQVKIQEEKRAIEESRKLRVPKSFEDSIDDIFND